MHWSLNKAHHSKTPAAFVAAIARILVFCSLSIAAICSAQLQTTQIADTVFNADGSYASGTINVSWSNFITAAGNSVPAGKLTIAIGDKGAVLFTLAPNANAAPAGSYYTATYMTSNGTPDKEYWVVPNVPTTTIAAIQSAVVPASVAAQTMTSAQVTALIGGYLPLNGGSLTGSLQLQADPTSAMQAATKNYVDNAIASMPQAPGNVISSTPKATQAVQQPVGSNLAVNIFQGSYYASQFQTGSMNNGISNLVNSTNCSTSSPTGLSGCTVYVDPTYKNNENPQGYG